MNRLEQLPNVLEDRIYRIAHEQRFAAVMKEHSDPMNWSPNETKHRQMVRLGSDKWTKQQMQRIIAEADMFWNHAYRHYLRPVPKRVQQEVKVALTKAGLALNGKSPAHLQIIEPLTAGWAM